MWGLLQEESVRKNPVLFLAMFWIFLSFIYGAVLLQSCKTCQNLNHNRTEYRASHIAPITIWKWWEILKGRVQPKRLFIWKLTVFFLLMDVCYENLKNNLVIENFCYLESISNSYFFQHSDWMCSYCSLDAELLLPEWGVIVPRMWFFFL